MEILLSHRSVNQLWDAGDLGGVSDIWTANLPRTGYLHVSLQPGDYAWVVKVPDSASKVCWRSSAFRTSVVWRASEDENVDFIDVSLNTRSDSCLDA